MQALAIIAAYGRQRSDVLLTSSATALSASSRAGSYSWSVPLLHLEGAGSGKEQPGTDSGKRHPRSHQACRAAGPSHSGRQVSTRYCHSAPAARMSALAETSRSRNAQLLGSKVPSSRSFPAPILEDSRTRLSLLAPGICRSDMPMAAKDSAIRGSSAFRTAEYANSASCVSISASSSSRAVASPVAATSLRVAGLRFLGPNAILSSFDLAAPGCALFRSFAAAHKSGRAVNSHQLRFRGLTDDVSDTQSNCTYPHSRRIAKPETTNGSERLDGCH